MNLIRQEMIIPCIYYTITNMEFPSINVRMAFANTKIMTPSGPVKQDIKHSTVININKSMNYFKQKYQVSFNTSRFERFQIKTQ